MLQDGSRRRGRRRRGPGVESAGRAHCAAAVGEALVPNPPPLLSGGFRPGEEAAPGIRLRPPVACGRPDSPLLPGGVGVGVADYLLRERSGPTSLARSLVLQKL